MATGAYDGWRVEGFYVDPQTGLHETADYNFSAGYTDSPESAPARFMVRFGETPFNPDGTFSSRGRAARHQDRRAVGNGAETQTIGGYRQAREGK